MTKVDVLVFGPHPDDIEIGAGGAVATHVDLGYRVGLCDLTRGELGSNGTREQRMDEAQAAAEVLGVAWRENLEWPDGEIAAEGRSVPKSGRPPSCFAAAVPLSHCCPIGAIGIPIMSRPVAS